MPQVLLGDEDNDASNKGAAPGTLNGHRGNLNNDAKGENVEIQACLIDVRFEQEGSRWVIIF